jgi:hypothetical protein
LVLELRCAYEVTSAVRSAADEDGAGREETMSEHEPPDHQRDDQHGLDDGSDDLDRRLHRIRSADLSEDTLQTTGMRRREAISGRTVGSSDIWMGETIVPPATGSGNHHHGESETGIYVVEGHPEFVFLAERARPAWSPPPVTMSTYHHGCRTAKRTQTPTTLRSS